MSEPADVFISYSQTDREAILRVAEGLQKAGLSVWFDARLNAGSAFDEAIVKALRAAKAVLVVWSKASVESQWVRAEATEGAKRGVLVAARLEACDPYPPFNLVHMEDLSGWRGEEDHSGWIRTRDAVKRRLGQETPASPAPARKTRPQTWIALAGGIAAGFAVLGGLYLTFGQPKPSPPSHIDDLKARNAVKVTPYGDAVKGLGARVARLESMAGDDSARLNSAQTLRRQHNQLSTSYNLMLSGQFGITDADVMGFQKSIDFFTQAVTEAENAPAAAPAAPAPTPTPPAPEKPAFTLAEQRADASFTHDLEVSMGLPVAGAKVISGLLGKVKGGQLKQVIVTASSPKHDEYSMQAARRFGDLVAANLQERGVPADLIITDVRRTTDAFPGQTPVKIDLSLTWKPAG